MTDFETVLTEIDARLARLPGERGVPGVAWGVVREGRLVHSGGAGTVSRQDPTTPTADHVFRIASMTKSFTAATVLLLRDEGRLRLDDPVALHVPALADWRPYAADAAPVTVRDLLTMSAGLATDDPWGDRQQGLPLDAFQRLLAEGPSFALPPGVVFEYSNLGYGILGRVVTAAAGHEYREVVRERLLAPLAMASTGYLEEAVPADRLVHGYARLGDELVREGRDGYGALASMGGVYSTVRDLATWVAGFLDAFPSRDDPEGPHPLRRATRREMQQVHRATGVVVRGHAPGAVPRVLANGYGFGLDVALDPELGTLVSHAGGYPGFGSHMAWHPASGLGVIGLGSLRYAPMRPNVDEALRTLLEADVAPRRGVRPLPALERTADAVERLLVDWDDSAADTLFAMNMDLDLPRDHRRAAVAAAAASIGGPFRADASRPAVSGTPAERTWWLRGARGWLRLQARVTPEPSPRLQSLVVEAVADPSEELLQAARHLLASTSTEGRPSPELRLGDAFDREGFVRAGLGAAVRFGSMRLGALVAGDGRERATWRLETERGGPGELRVVLDHASGAVVEAGITAPDRSGPPEGW